MRLRDSFVPLGFALLASACAETVSAPPAPPVAWATLTPTRSPATAPRSSATAKERQVARLYVDALASGRPEDLAAVLDEEAHFRFAGARDIQGRANVVKTHLALFDGLEDRTIALTRVFVTESAQALEWSLSARDRSRGRPVAIDGLALLWTKDDGSITDIHLYFDEALLQVERGLHPEPPISRAIRAVPPAKPEIVEQHRTSQEESGTADVRAAIQALEDNHEAVYMAAFDDGVSVKTLESAEPTSGKAPLRVHFRTMHQSIGYLATSIENMWGLGQYVVVEYQVMGEMRGPIGWVPVQRDKLVRLSIVDVAEVRGSRISKVSRYDDPLQIVSSP
jgi:ketosteroid isomerase-like protein